VYFPDGSLKTLTYPSGNVATYTVGGAGRPTQLTDSNNTNYASSVTYAPHGAVTGMSSGSGIVTSNIYNNRLQPALLSALGQTAVLSLCYDFHSGRAVNVTSPTTNQSCNFNPYTTGNNGNVFQVVNKLDSTRSTAFSYDLLNRITQANTTNTTSSNCWGEKYTLDNWGNLTNVAGVSSMGSCWTETLNAAPANNLNQLNGYCHDAAGNFLLLGTCPTGSSTPTYSYDPENRLNSTAGYTYYYDADGVRMEKLSGSTGTMYWAGPGGEYLTETDLSGNINEEYIFFNGARIARVDRPSGTVHYYFSNHLGSHAVVTSAAGACEQDIEYYPYGGVVADHCPNVAQHYKFTGKERDTESGLDNFGARYYGSSMERMMSPDPVGGSLANPQTLNKYAYVMNNPLRYSDPTGLYGCADDAKGATEHCTSDADKRFEASRQHHLQSKNADVRRAAGAYGDRGQEVVNARGDKVTVAFSSDVASNGEGGVAHSVLDANGATPISNSTVTFNPNDKGTALDADVGHEGSHVADAQDVAASITYTSTSFHVGQDISQYASEQRAYRVTDSIYRSANEPYNGCGNANCALGAGSSPLGMQGRIDAILRAHPDIYHGPDGRPLTPQNPGGNVLNIVVPH
jgi:RHS repeat-associated protein